MERPLPRVDVVAAGDTFIVRPFGEITSEVAGVLRHTVNELRAAHPVMSSFVLDLRAVSLVDPTGLAALVHLDAFAHAQAFDVRLSGASPRDTRLLAVTDLLDTFGAAGATPTEEFDRGCSA